MPDQPLLSRDLEHDPLCPGCKITRALDLVEVHRIARQLAPSYVEQLARFARFLKYEQQQATEDE